MNEVARRAQINSGRLSIIERGVPATSAEADRIRTVLIAASTAITTLVGSDQGEPA